MYYLQSRYYDPEVCRFINADEYASTGQEFLGCNMFVYCNNNPVDYCDRSGKLPCQNTMRMTSDGGLNLYYRIYKELSDAEGIPTDRIEYSWDIDSGGEAYAFATASVALTVFNAYSAASSVYAAACSAAAAGASAGASLLAAGKFLYHTVDCVVGTVRDMVTTVTVLFRYASTGRVVVQYTIPIDIEVGLDSLFKGIMEIKK